MPKIKLKDSYYQSFISEKLKSLHYQSLNDFNLVIESLELLTEKQQTQSWIDKAKLLPKTLLNRASRWFNSNKALNNQLEIIEGVFEDLDCYVYGEHLLANPESYDVIDGAPNTALDAKELTQLGQDAFKDILLDNIQSEIKTLQKLSLTEQQTLIENVMEKDERNTKVRKTMASTTAPDLGDERSTATMSLVNHCGSMSAFRAFETLLRKTPGVENLQMSSGLPEFDWTDSMDFKWSVKFMIADDSPHQFGVLLGAKEEIDFSHQEHELKIPANTQRFFSMDIWLLKQGEPHLKTETIHDNLMEKAEIAINMFLMLAIAEKLNKLVSYNNMFESIAINLPTRERLWDTVIALSEPDLSRFAGLISILRHGGLEIEFTDVLDELAASDSAGENAEEVDTILDRPASNHFSPIASRTRSQGQGSRPAANDNEPIASRTRARFGQ